jgi:hypothetical protein
MFHLYGDVTITGEGLQKLGLYSAPRAFEYREGSLSCHTCCDTGADFFGLIQRTAPFSRLLHVRHTRGCGESILTRILTGPHSVASYDTQGGYGESILTRILKGENCQRKY